ncbi:hypothetical protein ACFVVC_01785 [Pseudarthrobacter sp. NPDC058196]|uniref:hypothetical protein n=1 Tax=Pseudarthrobacter sp. NPDC058196 TaxID=3346376 RepID=UPI0036D87646
MRVFIGEGTFCLGFQLKDGLFNEPVLRLFEQVLELKIPHNVFAAWMVSLVLPPPSSRPVDILDNMPLLQKHPDWLRRPVPSDGKGPLTGLRK